MANPENPYLPSNLDRLSMMLMSLGSGISGAEASGRSGWAGIAPAASMYAQGMGQANQQAIEAQRWQMQFGEQAAYRRAQEEALKAQTEQRQQELELTKSLMPGMKDLIAGGGPVPGMGVPPATPTMGPSADLLRDGPQKVQYLTEKHGLSPAAAAGVVGGLYQESKFNPTAVGDGGSAVGQAQWRGDRATGLVHFAQSQGKAPSDPQVQLDYLVTEMKGGDMGAQRAYAMLQTAKTPEEATTAMMHFFRPAGYTPNNPTAGSAYPQRVQYSQALMPGASGNPQITPQPQQQPGTVQPPRVDPMRFLPYTLSKTLAPFGQAGISIGNSETDRFMKDQDRLQREEQFGRTQGATERNQKVGPDNRPNTALLDTEAEAERRKLEAQSEVAASGEIVKGATTRYEKEIRPKALAAQQELEILHGARNVLDSGMTTGIASDARMFGGRVLSALGFDQPQSGINRVEFNNLIAKRVQAIMSSKDFGSGTAISEGDRKFVEAMAGKDGNMTDEDLKKVLGVGEKIAQYNLNQHSQEVGRMQKLKGFKNIDPGYFEIKAPSYGEWKKANGKDLPQVAGTVQPNGFAAHPNPNAPTNMQPSAAPAPGFVSKGYRFKGGNPADQGSWEKVQ